MQKWFYKINISKHIKLVNQIAIKAGYEIVKIYDNYNIDDSGMIKFKDDNSPLTKADIASHNYIKKKLLELFPDIPILSEEDAKTDYNVRKDWSTFWLVDPLDGTKEFIKKNGEFSVNIALIQNGIPIFGVVFAPILNTLWYGAKGIGSFKINSNNKKTINKVCSFSKDDSIIVVASRSHISDALKVYLEKIRKHQLIQMGSSIKMCLVADGSAHIYPRLGPTMEWDTGAAHAVVLYAGGDICDIKSNQTLKYNKPDLLNPGFIVSHQGMGSL